MGKQSVEDFVYRNSYEAAITTLVLVLAYILYRKRGDRAWLFIAIAAAMRLLPTVGNLWTYPLAIFPVLWVMYHGSLVIGVWAMIDAIVRRPNKSLETTRGT